MSFDSNIIFLEKYKVPKIFYFFLFLQFFCFADPLANTYTDLVSKQIIKNGDKPFLHLGCGQNYLQGYVNIDLPWEQRSLHSLNIPDYFSNVLDLRFPNRSVMKIESHHMFEHFSRPKALALLCAWAWWLDIGGILLIETPDFEAAIHRYLGTNSFLEKQVILRHLFGSHEANWAYHYDGWCKEKFSRIFSALGLLLDEVSYSSWKSTDNIIVKAIKTDGFSIERLRNSAFMLLKESSVDESLSEKVLWEVWCNEFDESLNKMIFLQD